MAFFEFQARPTTLMASQKPPANPHFLFHTAPTRLARGRCGEVLESNTKRDHGVRGMPSRDSAVGFTTILPVSPTPSRDPRTSECARFLEQLKSGRLGAWDAVEEDSQAPSAYYDQPWEQAGPVCPPMQRHEHRAHWKHDSQSHITAHNDKTRAELSFERTQIESRPHSRHRNAQPDDFEGSAIIPAAQDWIDGRVEASGSRNLEHDHNHREEDDVLPSIEVELFTAIPDSDLTAHHRIPFSHHSLAQNTLAPISSSQNTNQPESWTSSADPNPWSNGLGIGYRVSGVRSSIAREKAWGAKRSGLREQDRGRNLEREWDGDGGIIASAKRERDCEWETGVGACRLQDLVDGGSEMGRGKRVRCL